MRLSKIRNSHCFFDNEVTRSYSCSSFVLIRALIVVVVTSYVSIVANAITRTLKKQIVHQSLQVGAITAHLVVQKSFANIVSQNWIESFVCTVRSTFIGLIETAPFTYAFVFVVHDGVVFCDHIGHFP